MSVGARNGGIDLIRGVSILLVLLHHFNIAYRLGAVAVPGLGGWDAVQAVARNGNYAVTMFFAVSGFLITSNARRRWGALGRVAPVAFYRLRAARILPCLVLLLVAVNALGLGGVPIFGNQAEVGDTPSFWLVDLASLTFWMNVLMARVGWVNYALCVLWSLSVEEVFYLAFPVLCRVLRRERWLCAAWAVFIAAGPLWRSAHQDDEAGMLYAYLACFDGIAIGCCASVAAACGFAVSRRVAWAVGVAMAGLYLAGPISETNIFGVTLMAMGTAVLLAAAADPIRPARFGMVRRAVADWGRVSYELYLFHLLVLGGLRTGFPPAALGGAPTLGLFAAYLVASGALAMLVSRWFAAPLNRWLRGWRWGGVAAAAAR